ncbi:hypothetical protein QG37_00866 [Candidozyma auris]|uniref:Uncharacterized protein n=1 Tax=Candidozyma auris TaxID=498019 RepID=A0A0L0P730_CANAR|nr:hypothetical protein QG37_00866 [[Candida] auris]
MEFPQNGEYSEIPMFSQAYNCQPREPQKAFAVLRSKRGSFEKFQNQHQMNLKKTIGGL